MKNQILLATLLGVVTPGALFAMPPATYADGRPQADRRLEAKDQGVVIKHGGGPGDCDRLGAREAIVFADKGRYYLHYDGAGPKGWLASLATSEDLVHWEKRGAILDFGPPGSLDSASASTPGPDVKRTLGIARASTLDGPWVVSPEPIVPLAEQVENSSLYYEPKIKTWFLFTNHIGINDQKQEFTDAVWVYWSRDLNRWEPQNKAVVLDGRNCSWSKHCIGMPSVMKLGKRLAIFYDAPGGDSISHMGRDIGLAWLDLPLSIPTPTVK